MSTAGDVLKEMYAAEDRYLNAGSATPDQLHDLLACFAENVELHQADSLPYGGLWRGHDGMQRFFAAMGRTWEKFDMTRQEFLADEPTHAAVLTEVHARARQTGTECRFPILQTAKSPTPASSKSVPCTGTPRP